MSFSNKGEQLACTNHALFIEDTPKMSWLYSRTPPNITTPPHITVAISSYLLPFSVYVQNLAKGERINTNRKFLQISVEEFNVNMTCKLFGCFTYTTSVLIFPEATKSCVFPSSGMTIAIHPWMKKWLWMWL